MRETNNFERLSADERITNLQKVLFWFIFLWMTLSGETLFVPKLEYPYNLILYVISSTCAIVAYWFLMREIKVISYFALKEFDNTINRLIQQRWIEIIVAVGVIMILLINGFNIEKIKDNLTGVLSSVVAAFVILLLQSRQKKR